MHNVQQTTNNKQQTPNNKQKKTNNCGGGIGYTYNPKAQQSVVRWLLFVGCWCLLFVVLTKKTHDY